MKFAFLLYEGMTAMDLVGPHEILSRLPGAESYRVGLNKGSVRTDSGIELLVDSTLSEMTEADILLIPGAGTATTLGAFPEILEWVRLIHQKSVWTTSVCTGSLILGAAGVLKGKRATSHWAAIERLEKWGAVPVKERVVEDGKILTAAGVSAGIDMALTLASKLCSDQVAQAMQLAIEYDPRPPFDSGSPEKVSPLVFELLKAKMSAGFENG